MKAIFGFPLVVSREVKLAAVWELSYWGLARLLSGALAAVICVMQEPFRSNSAPGSGAQYLREF